MRALDHQLTDVLVGFSANSPSTINIDNGGVDLLDTLHDSLSSHAKLRRVQARALARKLYRFYHTDTSENDGLSWLTFTQLRDLANNGELEVLWYIRACHGLEDLSPEKLSSARELLRIRIRRLEASPAYRVGRLYFSNRVEFLAALERLLTSQIASLEKRIASLYTPAKEEHVDTERR